MAPNVTAVQASAPGGIGNMGPGLDALGCAVQGPRDEVVAHRTDEPGVSLSSAGHADLPKTSTRHTSAIAASAVLHEAIRVGAASSETGIRLEVHKHLPLSAGQGGSAASAVAGATSANALLGNPLGVDSLLQCCLAAEAKVSGRHLDNIAPSLLGGIVLVRSIAPIDYVRLPVPDNLYLVLAHPDMRLSTAMARRALPAHVPLSVATHQMAQAAAIVAACFMNDVALLGRAMDDRIAEPARAPLMPGFIEARNAALAAGALGASISGAGPTAFAVADDAARAEEIAAAMRGAYAAAGLACNARVTTVDHEGARVSIL